MDFLYGLWNGWTAVFVFVAHIFGWWLNFPIYDQHRNAGGWYVLGYLLGVGAIGGIGGGASSAARRR